MIRLFKGAIPHILGRNAHKWTQTILTKLAAGEPLSKTDKQRYNQDEIKTALLAETNEKCAYCESKFRHVTYGDVEHITPKSAVPARWFEWDNLTIACSICNGNKGVFHGDLLDPYLVDPEKHLWFFGATIFGKPGSDPGVLTERVLDLNRAELVERRAERLKGLLKQLEVIKRTRNLQLKEILKKDFFEETKADKEFAALARYVADAAREILV